MKKVIARNEEDTRSLTFDKKSKTAYAYYKNDDDFNDEHGYFKLVIKPINKIKNNHYLSVKMTLYKKVRQHMGLFPTANYEFKKLGSNLYSIKAILEDTLQFTNSYEVPNKSLKKQTNIKLETRLIYSNFGHDLDNYFSNLLWGKSKIKHQMYVLKKPCHSITRMLNVIHKSVANHEISCQLAMLQIYGSLKDNHGKFINDDIKKYADNIRDMFGIHLVGDTAFTHAKDNLYIVKGFSNKTKLSDDLLKNYFVVVDKYKHEILPLSFSTVEKLIHYVKNNVKTHFSYINKESAMRSLLGFY